MTVLIYLLMILSGLGMIFGIMKYKQGYPWAQNLTIICALITLALAFTTMMPDRGAQRQARRHREMRQQYQEITAEILGAHLAENFEGANILVITRSHDDHHLSGLEEGIDGRATLDIVTPDFAARFRERMEGEDLPEEEIEMMAEEMEMEMQADFFDEIIRDNLRNHDLIVSLIGLPYEVRDLRLWRDRDHPPMAVVGDHIDSFILAELGDKIYDGQIAAIVARRPDVGWQIESIPRNVQQAFEERYLLLTPENVEAKASEYPDLFEGY